ncbi:hypothetical protein DXC30_07805 [Butyribacter intestini]|nr:hypothetical protein DXC30_07805 [Butyribacter intestini]
MQNKLYTILSIYYYAFTSTYYTFHFHTYKNIHLNIQHCQINKQNLHKNTKKFTNKNCTYHTKCRIIFLSLNKKQL